MRDYHISDLKKFNRCHRFYWLDSIDEEKEYRPFVRLDEEVTELACKKLGITDCFRGRRGDNPDLALNEMHQHEWVVNARFQHDRLRIKVPFMHQTEDGWDIYFLFIGLYPHADDMQFYGRTIGVLTNLGVKIHDIYIIHLNAEYVRQETLDIDALFIISDSFYNAKNNPTINAKEAIYKHMEDYLETLDEMDGFDHTLLEEPVRSPRCTGRAKCRYYNLCFPDEESIPVNSVLTLTGAQKKYEMKKNGIDFLKDTDVNFIEGSRMQYAQIVADRTDGLFVDRLALKTWLSHIQYPITFLDFEWERFAIPPYQGMKPYDVLPFEYSLHILHEDGTVTHKVFLSIHDDRYEMAQSLVENIPDHGSLVAYNAYGAETIRLQELADMYPDVREALLDMCDRMEDLQLPFVNGIVYDVRMMGQWSLKKIMAMMDDPGYRDLDINHGMDAVFQWRHLDYEEQIENKEEIIENLKKYCGMDSYAMVVVYQWLLTLL